jgi:hypothetical protein
MSLKPNNAQEIPEATVEVARAAFLKGDDVYMKIRDGGGPPFMEGALDGVRGAAQLGVSGLLERALVEAGEGRQGGKAGQPAGG